MGKGKPRHNPDKKQNKMGGRCMYFSQNEDGTITWCDEVFPFKMNIYFNPTKICKGNPHNCIKLKYKSAACWRDKEVKRY